ncbi:MAG TPA: MetQ/NlpA family ABC transporter substrate-binding protein [Epulopiscium sp.]|nr:MetQ/NlpA family ABC transporter substrate-binding protein [Candidatus Epulonipiscium sp.]
MKKLSKLTSILTLSALVLVGVVGCGKGKADSGTLKVSVTSVPHAEIMEHIRPALEEKGIKLDLTVADDYNIHNRSLAEKETDANFFQHFPFLEDQIADFNYEIQEFGKIHIEPLGVYSKKYASLDELPDGATIALPNDPSNESRALALLHRNGLIEMTDINNLKSSILDIKANPKNIKFQEIDAAMLARTLDDVDASVINTNFALAADLNPTADALVIEDADSPYVNILTIRKGDENRKELKILQEVLMSDSVRDFINDKYKGAIVPVF